MPPREAYARPSGTDGTDHAFRMTIESKYQELPSRRKAAKRSASLCALLAALRTCWAVLVPVVLAGTKTLPLTTVAVAGVAAAVSFLRVLGSGFGAPHKEKARLLKLHASVGVPLLLLTQLSALAVEHATTPTERRRPAQLAGALSKIPSLSSLEPSVVENVERAVEGALDLGLFLSAIASAVAGRSYLGLKEEGAKKR